MIATVATPSTFARSRGITEILHFTTNKGLIGILSSGHILSRDGLIQAGELEPIRLLNCPDRSKDAAWTGYVNLSITDVNRWMLDRSKNWHEHDGIWWAVLAFDPAILDDPGVWFTTTNNTYSNVVRRAEGLDGLADLFTEPIPWGWYNSTKTRWGRATNQPTCDQAEVVYPESLPLDALTGIYVAEEDHIDYIAGMVANFYNAPTVPVTYKPAVFQ